MYLGRLFEIPVSHAAASNNQDVAGQGRHGVHRRAAKQEIEDRAMVMRAQHYKVDAMLQDMLVDQRARPSTSDKDLERSLHVADPGRDEIGTFLQCDPAALLPLGALHDASGQRQLIGVQNAERLVGK